MKLYFKPFCELKFELAFFNNFSRIQRSHFVDSEEHRILFINIRILTIMPIVSWSVEVLVKVYICTIKTEWWNFRCKTCISGKSCHSGAMKDLQNIGKKKKSSRKFFGHLTLFYEETMVPWFPKVVPQLSLIITTGIAWFENKCSAEHCTYLKLNLKRRRSYNLLNQ